MRKFLTVIFACIVLFGCGDDANPVNNAADVESALNGEWIIDVTEIEPNSGGIGGSNIKIGKFSAKSSVYTSNGIKVVVWESDLTPLTNGFTLSIANKGFDSKYQWSSYKSQSISGTFSNFDKWSGSVSLRNTTYDGTFGYIATVTATRK
jgi:hypothetical protein